MNEGALRLLAASVKSCQVKSQDLPPRYIERCLCRAHTHELEGGITKVPAQLKALDKQQAGRAFLSSCQKQLKS